MSEIIQGKILAEKIHKKIKQRVEKLNQPPGMAAILVGKDKASRLYVKLKERAAKEAGIYFEKLEFEERISDKKLIKEIEKLNAREDIHGILVQLPLPGHDEDAIIDAIKPSKDVDGFHQKQRKARAKGEPNLTPPVCLAAMKLIDATRQPLKGKSAIIISNNKIFAEPIIQLLKELGVEGKYIKPSQKNLPEKTKETDILVVAVGKPNFINKDMIKEGSILIDVGTNRVEGKLVGDISEDVTEKAGFISPVPGGVGPLTVAYLLLNVVKAYQSRK